MNNEIKNFVAENNIELKKVNVLAGPIHEGHAYNAEVWHDGMQIAHISDDGNGGMLMIDDHGHEVEYGKLEDKLQDANIVWFTSTFNGKDVILNMEGLFGEMFDEHMVAKEWKAKTRTKVFVQTDDCGDGEYYIYKRLYKVSDKKNNLRWEMALMDSLQTRFGFDKINDIKGIRSMDWATYRPVAKATA